MVRSRIKVMIIDDSALVRQTLAKIVEADPDLEVCATAQDPFVAAERLKGQVPDVITLDVEMPRMDGITFLRKIMSQNPIPVVICSSLAGRGSATLMDALEAGAVEVIQKPKIGTQRFFEESSIQITDILKAASQARPRRQVPRSARREEKLTADVMMSRTTPRAMAETTEKIILIGSSTGGPGAVGVILESMPRDAPGILVVQHMQEGFTKSFAERLDANCLIRVREAKDGDNVLRGQALIAPGGKHMLLKRSGARYYVQIKDGPLVSRHRPSVDVLFRSSARYGGRNCVAAILTGMGDDGAEGMKEIFDTGARTFAQDEQSCVVYGMPKEAVARGGVHHEIPLSEMAAMLLKAC